MKYFILPIMGDFYEENNSSFEYKTCSNCGNSVRVQKSDLKLISDFDFEWFSTTMDGDLIVKKEIVEKLLEIEKTIEIRKVTINRTVDGWVQVIPKSNVKVTDDSLRSKRELCEFCGGVVRVKFIGNSPHFTIMNNGKLSHISFVLGAPLMLIISEEIYRVFSELREDFSALEVPLRNL